MDGPWTYEAVADALQRELGLPDGTINSDDRLGFCDWWDSQNHVILILWVASQFNTDLHPELIEELTSVRAILEFLQRRTL